MRQIKFTTPLILLALAGPAAAQDGSLLYREAPTALTGPALTMQTGSFIYRELPPNARLKHLEVHDIVTVIVDYRTRIISEADVQSRKTSNLKMVLSDWLRFDGKNVKPAPQSDGDPTVGGTNNAQYRAQSDLDLNDSMSFKIAAEVVDVLPNGSLVLEGTSDVHNNEEHWQLALTGVVQRESIQPDRTVTSESIFDLKIVKREVGQVRDGYARGWAGRIWDKYKPF
ncbi:MAG: flagellar basal body L-ring protein FlgH [Planctomycetales bacterium]|nr:flagellar basal body L-ring protein FlgH [Planctomycetales bacterium]